MYTPEYPPPPAFESLATTRPCPIFSIPCGVPPSFLPVSLSVCSDRFGDAVVACPQAYKKTFLEKGKPVFNVE